MTIHSPTRAKLTTIAYFPEHFFLENLAVRANGSILITVLKHKQLWYVPTPGAELPVDPVLVHNFESAPMGIVEVEPDVFYVCTFGPATLENLVTMIGRWAGVWPCSSLINIASTASGWYSSAAVA